VNKLEDFLRLNAEKYPEKIAARTSLGAITYHQLFDEVAKKAETLKHAKGKAVVFRCQQDISFLVTYFAIHMAGAVAVPLEKDTPDEKFHEIENLVKSKTFAEDEADILFTTGTTGKSKGVIISHRTILADGENLKDSQGFTHDLRFIITGPMNHIGCLSKIYPVIICGASLHILDGMKDVNAFFNAIEQSEEKTGTFLVPASIRMLITLSKKKLLQNASKIDFIETGAAPIAQSDMEKLCSILPDTRLYNTYASTETGIIATYNYNDGKCIEGCLGKAMKNSSFYITPEGTIACQGLTLMSGYLGDEEKTRQIMHDDTLFTSDLGSVDENGMLRFLGREGDVINTGGYKVAPNEVEDVVLSMQSVKDCICIAASHPVMGCVLKLLVVMKEGETLDRKETASFIASKLEGYKVPFFYEQVDSIKRTYNGKLDRKAYQRQ